jgi:3-phenylpropionate/trans-cinnamate dioxygenase alpha subunit/dibenzofuran dioxygenase alpha subunit
MQGKLLDLERGLVSRQIFSDEEIYRREMESVFHHCWLFLGPESLIPSPGHFATNHMGEDPVIVWRDAKGTLRAFLNTCPHRGNQICLYDRGRTASLTCSYHGWTFDSEGKLTGVPFADEAYFGGLDREAWGLVEVPRVQSYGGMIFGCWDPGAPSLREYLGDLCWYFDMLVATDDLGGLEALPGCQRYAIVGNWKFFCDNFAGDGYHVPTSHASAFSVNATGANYRDREQREQRSMLHVAPAHGLGGFQTGSAFYQSDLARARELGAEVVDYVEERHQRLQERLKDVPSKLAGWTWGQIFPNLNLQGFDTALRGRVFALCLPKGPHASEIWQWNLIERAAPKALKEFVARTANRGQSGSGLIGVDDTENFERITEVTRTPMAQKLMLHYAMSLELEGKWPGQEKWGVQGMPGYFGPHFWETGQRRFYRYWAELMAMED